MPSAVSSFFLQTGKDPSSPGTTTSSPGTTTSSTGTTTSSTGTTTSSTGTTTSSTGTTTSSTGTTTSSTGTTTSSTGTTTSSPGTTTSSPGTTTISITPVSRSTPIAPPTPPPPIFVDGIVVGRSIADYFIGSLFNDTISTREGDDTILGRDGDDLLRGEDGNDSLNGGAGKDIVDGGPGNDTTRGGKGDDLVIGDRGNDQVFGDQGNDTVLGAEGDDTLFGGKGNDSLRGGAEDDLIFGDKGNDTVFGDTGNDCLQGGAGNDLLVGEEGGDIISGGVGNDTADGGEGDDRLFGGDGNDAVIGGAGDDFLAGDRGIDTLTGGDGADIFVLGRVGTSAGGGFQTTGGPGIGDADLIRDFKAGDAIGLAGGLSFTDLEISQGQGSNSSNTIIKDKRTGEFLAVLIDVRTNALDESKFTTAKIPPVDQNPFFIQGTNPSTTGTSPSTTGTRPATSGTTTSPTGTTTSPNGTTTSPNGTTTSKTNGSTTSPITTSPTPTTATPTPTPTTATPTPTPTTATPTPTPTTASPTPTPTVGLPTLITTPTPSTGTTPNGSIVPTPTLPSPTPPAFPSATPNQPPIVESGKTITGFQNLPLSLSISAPSDPEGQTISATVNLLPNPIFGLVVTGTIPIAINQKLTVQELVGLNFQPATNAIGQAGSFSYSVTDEQGGVAAAAIAININSFDTSANAPLGPIAGDDGIVFTNTNNLLPTFIDVLANDVSPQNGKLNIINVGTPKLGQTVNLVSQVQFIPGNVPGSTTFTYNISDALGTTPGTGVVSVQILPADSGPNNLIGGSLADNFNGLAGSDTIDGRGGNDTINGGLDNDVLVGNLGADTMTGGGGSNQFRYTSPASGGPTFDAASSAAINAAIAAGGYDLITDFTGLGVPIADQFNFAPGFGNVSITSQVLLPVQTTVSSNILGGTAFLFSYDTGGNTYIIYDGNGNNLNGADSRILAKLNGVTGVSSMSEFDFTFI